MAATLHVAAAAQVRPVAALRGGARAHPRGLDRSSLRRRTHHRLRRARRPRGGLHPGARCRRQRARHPTVIETLARDHPRRQARLVLVDDGREPEPRGRPHGAGHHQPGPHHRQHRSARDRRELHHRAVQRDGLAPVQQHHQPARRPRLHVAVRPRTTWPSSSASPESASHARTAWPTTRSSTGFCAGRSRGCGSSPPTPRTPGSTRRICSTCWAGSISWWCRTCTPAPRPPSWPTWSCPRPAGARRKGPSSTRERRIGLVKKVARAPGQALADFHIFKLVADAWGCGELFSEWTTPEAVFQILKRLSRGSRATSPESRTTRCSIAPGGCSGRSPRARRRPPRERSRSGACSRTAASSRPTARRACCSRSRGRCPSPPRRPIPLTLLTGRGNSSQWHTNTRTGKSAVLRRLAPRGDYVEMSPVDARDRDIATNDMVDVMSARASVTVRAFVTHAVQPGQVFIPMHGSKHQQARPSPPSIPIRASPPTRRAP